MRLIWLFYKIAIHTDVFHLLRDEVKRNLRKINDH